MIVVKIIDWDKKEIKEIETDSVKFGTDGIHYWQKNSGFFQDTIIPYQNFLGIKEA